jgi:hypothetical protein
MYKTNPVVDLRVVIRLLQNQRLCIHLVVQHQVREDFFGGFPVTCFWLLYKLCYLIYY